VIEARQRGVPDFAVVHDSFGCHAGNMQTLRQCLRETFQPVVTKARQTLQELAKVAEVPLPPLGKLNLERVKESDYFFD
jgi:Autographiviridae RNA polymerase